MMTHSRRNRIIKSALDKMGSSPDGGGALGSVPTGTN